jgi:D-alanyl-D-alanine carboxypeptidase/D-alanyl-D-alanine-endopeptidase (penicillin-binding protein 4)
LYLLGSAALAQAQGLPPEVDAAMARAKVPRDAVSVLVVDVQGGKPPRVSHRADVAMNPASVMKLVNTYAALDLLGPAYSWRTPVHLDGTLRDGVLMGNLHIQGQGDPTLVAERLWLLMRRIRGLGIDRIAGDIVLDRGAFALAPIDPGGFDGEPLRPYNAAPDALLLNYKSVVMTFVVDRPNNLARIHVNPPLAGVSIPASVPLSGGDCGDYRGGLRADFSDASRIRFAGSYPAACQERVWPIAFPDPAGYAGRAVAGMWHEVGGQLGGVVRDGTVPTSAGAPVFEVGSPTLAEVIRDINKYSNNVMAQQLFLSLSLPATRMNGQSAMAGAGQSAVAGAASFEVSREVVRLWWRERFGDLEPPILDNGSGLSRSARVSAQALARMLQAAWQSPQMPELMSSLPIAGVDGTMRRNRSRAAGSAHLKTGSLRDVVAIAGYVHASSGRRYVLVAMANHGNAGASRAAFDALLDWTIRDE